MLEPKVRQMVLCEDARRRKGSRGKFDLLGVINIVQAPAHAFPMHLSFTVYLCLTEARGSGTGAIVITNEDTDEEVYVGESHQLQFGADPIALGSVTLRVPLCLLPEPGLYRIDFVYNETVIGSHSLLVRETP
jgi:hypothetical protein